MACRTWSRSRLSPFIPFHPWFLARVPVPVSCSCYDVLAEALDVQYKFNMSQVWNAATYDLERRRLVPCFDAFYGSAAEMVARCCPLTPHILDLGAGTGILSATIVDRVQPGRLTLLDASADMLQRAAERLERWHPEIVVHALTEELPPGPFDAVVSALAIHHLSDGEKRHLYARILNVLSPGGIFINAEQVAGRSDRLQRLFESTHLDAARKLGSSDAEINSAIARMSYDRCATVADQIAWLEQAGYEDSDCFFRSFRFAVFGGWKPR
jgi:tRNA (cmo5U34)-methyltransferase